MVMAVFFGSTYNQAIKHINSVNDASELKSWRLCPN